MSRKKRTSFMDDLSGVETAAPSMLSMAEPVVSAPLVDDTFIFVPQTAQRYEPEEESLSLPDPVAMIKRAIQADLDPSVFTEKEFPRAANVIDWCHNPNLLGSDIRLYPKQFEVMTHFFKDCCYQCSDLDFIFDVPVDAHIDDLMDRFCLLEYGVCPRCRQNRTEMLSEWHLDPRFHAISTLDESITPRPVPPNEFTGVWGQRSGKSLIPGAILFTYILHRYLALPSVARYFDEPSNKVFDAVFVSPKLDQVRRNMWEPFRHAYQSSPWFAEYRAHRKDQEKKTGVTLYREQQTFLAFVGKRLAVHMSAANASTLRGGTRFFSTVDELAWFNVREDGKVATGARSGEQVYTALRNSLSTLQLAADWRRRHLGDYDALDAYMVNVSSPSSINDPIMQLGAVSPKRPRMFYTHYATWEVNPKWTLELLREQYDEATIQRDFAAIPPKAASPFFPDDGFETLTSLTYEPPKNAVKMFEYSIKIGEDPGGGRVMLQPTLSDIRPDRHTPRLLMVDNGEKKNAFAICIGRYLVDRDAILIEELIEVCPWKGHHIDLAWCYDEVVLKLVQSFNFMFVGYDRWESTYAINNLRMKHKTDAQRYSLKWKDFEAFRDDIRAAKVWFAKPEIDPAKLLSMRDLAMRARYPKAHLQVQLCTVNQFGKRVFKPDGGNDDLFRTSVLLHRFVRANQKLVAQKSKRVRIPGQQRFTARFASRGGAQQSSGQSRYSMTLGMGAQPQRPQQDSDQTRNRGRGVPRHRAVGGGRGRR